MASGNVLKAHRAAVAACDKTSCDKNLHHQHSATVDCSSLQVREYVVDIFQLRFADFRANLAFGCECDCFGEIFAAADIEPRIVIRFMTTSKMGV